MSDDELDEMRDKINELVHAHNRLHHFTYQLRNSLSKLNVYALWRWFMWVRPLALPVIKQHRIVAVYIPDKAPNYDEIIPLTSVKEYGHGG